MAQIIKIFIVLGASVLTYGATYSVNLAHLGSISFCSYVQFPFSESGSILQSITFSGVRQTSSAGGSYAADFSIFFASGNPKTTKQATFGVIGPTSGGCGVASTQTSPAYTYTGTSSGTINDQTLNVQSYNIPMTGLGIYLGNDWSGTGSVSIWNGNVIITTTAAVTTLSPTYGPTYAPTTAPTTRSPTFNPSAYPTTSSPTTRSPTSNPSAYPTTSSPTNKPTTTAPSASPTRPPAFWPTRMPIEPPTFRPTKSPTKVPSIKPSTFKPTMPTVEPFVNPSSEPTSAPTGPSRAPSASPSNPTKIPTTRPTIQPTKDPSYEPTFYPTYDPTIAELIGERRLRG